MSLPEGYGHVPGRARATALKLLDAAEKVGSDPTLIRAQSDGYLVPTEVLDFYDEHLSDEDDAIEAPTTEAAPFAHVETNHTPLTFDTLHDEEKGNEPEPKKEGEVTPPETETVGASTNVQAADGENANADGSADQSKDGVDGNTVPPTDPEVDGKTAPEPTAEDEKPAGNASKDAWADWAAKWHAYDKAEDLSRDDLRTKLDTTPAS